MPKTIPCWSCKGPGCETCNGGGVLSVYTQAEVKKLRDTLEYVLTTIEDIDEWWIDCPDKSGFDVEKIEEALKDGE